MQGKCKNKQVQMKLQYRAVEDSLQLGAACRCADDAVEPVSSVFRNTWDEILKIQYYMQILDPL